MSEWCQTIYSIFWIWERLDPVPRELLCRWPWALTCLELGKKGKKSTTLALCNSFYRCFSLLSFFCAVFALLYSFLSSLPSSPHQKSLLFTGDERGEEEKTRLYPSWQNEGLGRGSLCCWLKTTDWSREQNRQEIGCGSLTCSLWTIS